MDISTTFSTYDSAIGRVRIEHRGGRLTRLQIVEQEECGGGERCVDTVADAIFSQLAEYLEGRRRTFDIELDISGCTPFQRLVLNEIRAIPFGEQRTYKEIAESCGSPRAARAVGGVCNRNPILLVIPCHRVVGSSGGMTGYVAGLDTKRRLIELERL